MDVDLMGLMRYTNPKFREEKARWPAVTSTSPVHMTEGSMTHWMKRSLGQTWVAICGIDNEFHIIHGATSRVDAFNRLSLEVDMNPHYWSIHTIEEIEAILKLARGINPVPGCTDDRLKPMMN